MLVWPWTPAHVAADAAEAEVVLRRRPVLGALQAEGRQHALVPLRLVPPCDDAWQRCTRWWQRNIGGGISTGGGAAAAVQW